MGQVNSFTNKVVWITGASSGIGEALAYRFVELGAKLILSSNDAPELERVHKRCVELCTLESACRVHIIEVDLIEIGTMPEKAEQAIALHGNIDFLINNGGISQRSLAKDTPISADQRLMNIDYMGHVALTKALLPHFLQQKSGHIICTSSVAGLMGIPRRTGYCAAKHALHGFFNALRHEVSQDNIKITLICPAAVQTQIAQHSVSDNGKAFGQKDAFIEKGITPDQCASEIIQAIKKGKELLVLGRGLGRLGIRLNSIWPAGYAWLIKRHANL